jgi:catechol 2,3-dioxygenase-like lactoylglutathione lyase family enzyme
MLNGVNGIHHIALSVPDLAVARNFYVDLLGFEVVGEMSWDQSESVGKDGPASVIDEILGIKSSSAKQLMIRAGNLCLEFFEYTYPAQLPQDPNKPVNSYGYTHFALDVTDIESVYQRLLTAGVKFHTAPKPGPGLSSTYARDPFGNVIEIQEIFSDSAVPAVCPK